MSELELLRAQLSAAVRRGDREKAKALTALCFRIMSPIGDENALDAEMDRHLSSIQDDAGSTPAEGAN